MPVVDAWFRARPKRCERCGGEFLRLAERKKYPKSEHLHVHALWKCEDCGHIFAAPVSRKHAVYVLVGGTVLVVCAAHYFVVCVVARSGLLGSLLAVLAAVGLLCYGVYWLRQGRHLLRQARWRAVQQRGMPLCLECGYDLRGAASERCPECGAKIAEETRRLIGTEAGENAGWHGS